MVFNANEGGGAQSRSWAAWPGAGELAFWAVVFDEASSVRLYVNGVDYGAESYVDSYGASPGNFRLAARDFTPSRYFNGQMAHVAIFERALTAQEIVDIYERGSEGIRGYW